MCVEAFQRMLAQQVPRAVVLTCTSNAYGGHPVSLRNATAVSALCRKHGVLLIIDAARFAENAALLKLRDPECRELSVREISRRIFALADGCMMSAKKNALVHIGGFLAVRDRVLAERLRENLIVTEGFESYGGLAGRDLDAIALGLQEVLSEDLLFWRIGQVERLAQQLVSGGVPVELPASGHAVYVDAGALLGHIPAGEFPGHAFACAMYLEGGVRTCEIGSLMFPGRAGGPELTRLAVPWRTYTDSHLQHVAATAAEIAAARRCLRGLRLISAPKALRHFKATLAPIEPAPARVEEVRAAP
jgi:tryptophanase